MSRRIVDLNTKPGLREGWKDFLKDFSTALLLSILMWVITILTFLTG